MLFKVRRVRRADDTAAQLDGQDGRDIPQDVPPRARCRRLLPQLHTGDVGLTGEEGSFAKAASGSYIDQPFRTSFPRAIAMKARGKGTGRSGIRALGVWPTPRARRLVISCRDRGRGLSPPNTRNDGPCTMCPSPTAKRAMERGEDTVAQETRHIAPVRVSQGHAAGTIPITR